MITRLLSILRFLAYWLIPADECWAEYGQAVRRGELR